MAPPTTESDIVKALESRVADLEGRVRKLEQAGGSAPAVTNPCPFCGGMLKLTSEGDHPTFGVAGLKVRTFTCEGCGKTVKRDFDPRKAK